jgi:hypothetical protein
MRPTWEALIITSVILCRIRAVRPRL